MKLNFRYIRARPVNLPYGKKRPLVFYHIPRCGGTTLRIVLQFAANAGERPIHILYGTIYGQFLGPGKEETSDSIDKYDYSSGALVAGHIPWGSIGKRAPAPVAITILRAPGDRLVSQFKLGLSRDGWDAGTSIEDLRSKGLIVDNVATRMLAGVTSGDIPIGQDSLEKAKSNLSKMFLASDLTCADALFGAVLGAFGCPDVMMVTGNLAAAELSTDKCSSIQAASEEMDSLDWQLFEQVRNKLLLKGKETLPSDVGDPRPEFMLAMPKMPDMDGIQAMTVAKSKLPDVEAFLKEEFSDHDISVSFPEGVHP